MTVREMVKNLLDTGTPFDYKNVDFLKLLKLIMKHHKKHRDSANASDPALLVGFDSNPDKNQIYIEKDRTFEDE